MLALAGLYRVRFGKKHLVDHGIVTIRSDGRLVGGDRLAFYTGNVDPLGNVALVVRRHSQPDELSHSRPAFDILLPLDEPICFKLETSIKDNWGNLRATTPGRIKDVDSGRVSDISVELEFRRLL